MQAGKIVECRYNLCVQEKKQPPGTNLLLIQPCATSCEPQSDMEKTSFVHGTLITPVMFTSNHVGLPGK